MPTTANSLASTTVSQPASRMRGPPTPKNSHAGSRRRRAWTSCAPYISPEASPAEIRTRTSKDCSGLVVCTGRGLGLSGQRCRYLLILVLQLIQFVVHAALRQKLLMRAHFADFAFVHHDDFVGALHGGKPMRNHQRRSSFHHAAERVAHAEFGFRVYARSGFVKNQNLR